MNIDEIFSCRTITKSSLELYKTKLKILNDNKPIKNLNYLYDIDKINEKIKSLKPNTRRTYIIAITSILACLNKEDKKPNKKIKKLYADYSKLLDEYNNKLRDQTEITENTQVISKEDINKVYDEIKQKAIKKNATKEEQQNYVILSLYTLQPPRRNRDFVYMKVIEEYKPELSKEFNYYDGSKFYYNVYKTRGHYGEVIIDAPEDLQIIINNYIKNNNIKNNDFLLTNKKNEDLTKNTNEMTLVLNKIFKGKVGASMLRRSYLTNKYSKEQEELNKDANAMSSSKATIQNNYIKKS